MPNPTIQGDINKIREQIAALPLDPNQTYTDPLQTLKDKVDGFIATVNPLLDSIDSENT